jgi:thioredoxin 1
MRNSGKAIIVIALVIAVAVILMGKRNGANTAPPPATEREVATASPTEAPPAPVAEPAEPAASPLAAQEPTPTAPTASASAAPPAPVREETTPKPQPRTPDPKPEPAKPQAAPKTVEPPREDRTPAPSPPSRPARRPQLLELGSKTCVPCKMMAPILEELRRDYGGQLEVLFYDIYERRDMADAYQIRVIPTQVFLDAEGKEFFRHQGFYPKEDILARFREHGITLESK